MLQVLRAPSPSIQELLTAPAWGIYLCTGRATVFSQLVQSLYSLHLFALYLSILSISENKYSQIFCNVCKADGRNSFE